MIGLRRRHMWLVTLALTGLGLVGCAGNKALEADLAAAQDRLATQDAQLAELRGAADALNADKAKLEGDLRKALSDLEAERKLRIEGDRIIMPDAVLFASGSIKISDDGKKVLDRIASALKEHGNREIVVEGHTDDVPIAAAYQHKYRSNWELSSLRATAVVHHLIKQTGSKPGRFVASGFGQFRPVADNKSEAGRQKNRRVVIVVGKKQ